MALQAFLPAMLTSHMHFYPPLVPSKTHSDSYTFLQVADRGCCFPLRALANSQETSFVIRCLAPQVIVIPHTFWSKCFESRSGVKMPFPPLFFPPKRAFEMS